jgi:hypothetical protein
MPNDAAAAVLAARDAVAISWRRLNSRSSLTKLILPSSGGVSLDDAQQLWPRRQTPIDRMRTMNGPWQSSTRAGLPQRRLLPKLCEMDCPSVC